MQGQKANVFMMNRNALVSMLAAIASVSAVCSPASATIPADVASSFEASLAAARARAGDTYVNGTVNVLIEPSRLTPRQDATSPITTSAPVTVIDPRLPVRQVNVVVQSTTRLVVDVPVAAGRAVEIAPVMTQREFARTTAVLPVGAVVIPNPNGLREITVVRYTNLADVVVR